MFYGLWMLIYILSGIGYNFLNVLLVSPFIVLFILLGVAGYLLLEDKKYGSKLSIVLQSIQIVQFSILGFQFKFGAGCGIIVGLKNELMNLTVNFIPIYAEANWEINHGNDFYLYINIVPIFIIYLLSKTAIKE
jgi:hypothetical protein